MIALRCSHLCCDRPEWTHGRSRVDDVSIAFQEGALHGIRGESGSGKTLLLHLLGLCEIPDSGAIDLFGQKVPNSDQEVRIALRNTAFGFVFANPCLLPALTVAENIAMPLFRMSDADEARVGERVCEMLEQFGLEELGNTESGTLEPDEQSLVALARALVHRPRILLLVSPARPLTLFPHVRRIVERLGVTCIWSFSEPYLAGGYDRELTLIDGRIAAERLSLP